MGPRFSPDSKTLAFCDEEFKNKYLEVDTEKNCELSFILPNQCMLSTNQKASQAIGITVSAQQRWCWVPAVWLGNPACCLPHLEGYGILALAPCIYWSAGEGDGKTCLGKTQPGMGISNLVLNPWWPKGVALTVWSSVKQRPSTAKNV